MDSNFDIVYEALKRLVETESGNYWHDDLPPSIVDALEIIRKIEEGKLKTTYTIEVYKNDKRYVVGHRLTYKMDYDNRTREEATLLAKELISKGVGDSFAVCLTYVTKKNLLSGKEFQERYDTPHFCSPSSETYWSM